MKTYLYPEGSRVRIRRGDFPIDPRWIGRAGLVVKVDEYRPDRYGVVLDGESAAREFTTDSLEALEAGASIAEAGDPGDAAG